MINDIIRQGAAATGLSVETVRLALAGALSLLDKHAARQPLRDLYAAVPGAEGLAHAPDAQVKPSSGGLFGGLMRSAGGLSGAAMADAMGMLERAKRGGVDKADLKILLKVAEDHIRATSGRDLLRDVIASVPGVGALLTSKA